MKSRTRQLGVLSHRSFAPRPARVSAPAAAPQPAPAPLAPSPERRVSLLVPYRESGPERARIWDFLRSLYGQRFPTWEIVTAPGPEGDFCRAGALCDAAHRATGDIFVIADADVWCDGIGDAVLRVASGATWVDPASDQVVRMTPEATERALSGGPLSAEGAPTLGHRRVPCGGIVAITREAFLRCLPDRRFVGWGAEDHAWAADLLRMYGPATPGARAPLYHFHHPHGERTPSKESWRLLGEHLRGSIQAGPAATAPGPAPAPAPAARPRITILADVRNWAWAKKAQALKGCLSDRFSIEILYGTEHAAGPAIAARKYDLLHTFEVNQVGGLPGGVPHTTGITAHVWGTYEQRHGAGTVKRWTAGALGIHANSRLLQRELEGHLGRPVFYVPNGVDEAFYRRLQPRVSTKLIVGFVGKDNATRKGYEIVQAACKRAGVQLRDVRRRAHNALSSEDMRAFYQGIHVLAVASDMDGTPNPALEAAACECAIVSNPIGNMPEFIEPGVNGLLVERSVESLAAALSDLSRRPIEEVEEMGRAARRTVKEGWTWTIQAENYAHMWMACLGGSR